MALRAPTITDETGRVWVVPAGGADDAGDAGTGDTAAADGETPDADGQPDSQQQDDSDDGDRAGGVRALRADLVAERRRRQELEAQLAEAQQAQETEAERRQREAAEVEQLRTRASAGENALRIAAIETAATAARFVDPTEVAALLDYAGSLDTIEVDLANASVDRDTVTELVEQLATAKPHLIVADERQRYERGGSDTQGTDGATTTDDPSRELGNLIRKRLGVTAR
jgi:hypothetical protein